MSLPTLFHPGRKGSGCFVTGFILVVFTFACKKGPFLSYSSINPRPQTLGVSVLPVHPFPSPTPRPSRTVCASTSPWRLPPRETWRGRRWRWDHYQRGKQHCRDGKTHAEVWLDNTRDIPGRLASWLFQWFCCTLHLCRIMRIMSC